MVRGIIRAEEQVAFLEYPEAVDDGKQHREENRRHYHRDSDFRVERKFPGAVQPRGFEYAAVNSGESCCQQHYAYSNVLPDEQEIHRQRGRRIGEYALPDENCGSGRNDHRQNKREPRFPHGADTEGKPQRYHQRQRHQHRHADDYYQQGVPQRKQEILVRERFRVIIEPDEIAPELVVDERIIQHPQVRDNKEHRCSDKAGEHAQQASGVPFLKQFFHGVTR